MLDMLPRSVTFVDHLTYFYKIVAQPECNECLFILRLHHCALGHKRAFP